MRVMARGDDDGIDLRITENRGDIRRGLLESKFLSKVRPRETIGGGNRAQSRPGLGEGGDENGRGIAPRAEQSDYRASVAHRRNTRQRHRALLRAGRGVRIPRVFDQYPERLRISRDGIVRLRCISNGKAMR